MANNIQGFLKRSNSVNIAPMVKEHEQAQALKEQEQVDDIPNEFNENDLFDQDFDFGVVKHEDEDENLNSSESLEIHCAHLTYFINFFENL